jgi:hypothetical protein
LNENGGRLKNAGQDARKDAQKTVRGYTEGVVRKRKQPIGSSVVERRFAMCESFVTAKLAMAISEERINHKRQPIVLERFNLMQYVRPIVRSLLSFLF